MDKSYDDELKGGKVKVNQSTIKMFSDVIEDIWSDQMTYQRRTQNDDVRYCQWAGQSDDGKKWASKSETGVVFPFDGASDTRVRMADSTVNFLVALTNVSVLRSLPIASGVESMDEPLAAKIRTLLRWIISNQLRQSYQTEMEKVAQYVYGDSPGVGFIGVFWRQLTGLRMETITIEDLMGVAAEAGFVEDEATAEQFAEFISGGEESAVVDLLSRLYPMVEPEAIPDMMKGFREKGEAEVPVPYVRRNAPVIRAYRLFDDLFIPLNTVTDVQRARIVIIREWLSAAELRERILTEGYDRQWVKKVIGDKNSEGQEGKTAFPDAENYTPPTGDYSAWYEHQPSDNHKGEYEVLHAIYRATNKYGVSGIYKVPFSAGVKDMAAWSEAQIVDEVSGEYPFVAFAREYLNNKLLDSRGIPELVMTEQRTLKTMRDAYVDRTTINTIPPIKKNARRGDFPVDIGPGAEIMEQRQGDVEFMKMPGPARENEVMRPEIKEDVAEYFGIPIEGVSPDVIIVLQQHTVNKFISSWREVIVRIVQMALFKYDEQKLMSIVGGNQLILPSDPEAIRELFDVVLNVDVRDTSLENVLTKAKAIREGILPIDTQGAIMRSRMAGYLLTSLDPNLAEYTMRPVQDVSAEEIKDVDFNYLLVANGVEPPMVPGGQNYQLRLQRWMENGQRNMQEIQQWDERRQEMFKRHMQHLQFMVQQEQNAEIGRVGAEPVDGEVGEGGVIQ